MNITEFLLKFVSFSQDELDEILSHFTKEQVQKNQILVQQGQICRKLYFIEKGLGRSYYLKEDGKEVTQWFFGSGEFMSSADSFFKQNSSFYYLEALENSILYSIPYDKMELLLTKYHNMEKFTRILAIEMLGHIVQKVNAIQFQTARQRYDYLISEFPDIYDRVPLGNIASYLGITQETLSRIRK